MLNVLHHFLVVRLYAFVLAILWPSPASAQNYEQEIRVPARETSAQKNAQVEAEEARKRKETETAEVTYEQVLSDPDNVDLNYRYAQSQVLRGDLKGASATLERILMVKPEMAKIRLLRAIVLFRLDDLTEAEQEFNALASLPKSEELRSQIDDYLRQIHLRSEKTHLDARLGAGFEYDSNRNASPLAGQKLFFDLPLDLSGSSLRTQDTSILSLGSIDLTRDLGAQAGHQLFASLNYYRADQTVVKFLDLQAYSAALGGVYKTPFMDITPSGFFNYILIDRQSYLRMRGGRLQLDKHLSGALKAFIAAQYAYYDYLSISSFPTAPDQNGNEISGSTGMDWAFNPTMKLSLMYAHANKNAAQGFWAYQKESLTASHSWLLGKGLFLISSAAGEFYRYRDADLTVSSRIRQDKTLALRATLGAPLSFITPFLKDASLTLNYEYYYDFSNIINYRYINHKIYSMVMYRWSL